MFRRVCDLVRWYLVGLVESVDAGVAERARQLWRCETPSVRDKAGRPADNDGATDIRESRGQVDGILARLKRDHPDLAQQVIDGELSANAAAQQLGWRKPRVLLTSPEQVAAKLRDHYNVEDLAELAQQLRVILHHTSQTSRARETSAAELKSVECDSRQSFTLKKQKQLHAGLNVTRVTRGWGYLPRRGTVDPPGIWTLLVSNIFLLVY